MYDTRYASAPVSSGWTSTWVTDDPECCRRNARCTVGGAPSSFDQLYNSRLGGVHVAGASATAIVSAGGASIIPSSCCAMRSFVSTWQPPKASSAARQDVG